MLTVGSMQKKGSFLAWSILVLLFLGCGEVAEPPEHNAAWLREMGSLRTESAGHALLLSPSQMMACLPYAGASGAQPDTLPVDGLYFGPLKLVADWRWSAEAETVPVAVAGRDTVRPDYIHTYQHDHLSSRLTLDPDHPAALLELGTPPKHGAVELTLRFDVRPVSISTLPTRMELDEERNILLVGSDVYGFVAVASTGAWLLAPDRERRDYPVAYPPLDGAATLFVPGTLRFEKPEDARVVIGAGLTRASATASLFDLLEDPEGIRLRTAQHVLAALNRAPLVSADTILALAAAWDRWLMINHFPANVNEPAFAAMPPLGLTQEGDAMLRALPAWWWATAGDRRAEVIVDTFLTAADTMPRPEDTLLELVGWLNWVDLSGNAALVKDNRDRWLALFDQLGKTLRMPPGEGLGRKPLRWTRRFDVLHVPVRGSEDHTGLRYLAKHTTERARMWNSLDDEWYQDYKETSSYRLPGVSRDELPIPTGLKKDRFLWTQQYLEAWQRALNNPNYHLGYVETTLFTDRDDRTSHFLTRLVPDAWRCEQGFRWNDDLAFANICFTAPAWTIRYTELQASDEVRKQDWKAFYHPAYAAWFDNRPRTMNQPVPGGSPEALTTIAERVLFLYEGVLGLSPTPEHGRILVSPPGPRAAWEGRRTRCVVALAESRLLLDLDPYQGSYRITYLEGESKLTLDLQDVPVDGEWRRASLRFSPGREVLLERKPGSDGQLTLFLNGSELRMVERGAL